MLCFVGIFHPQVYLHIHGASLEDEFASGGIRSFLLKWGLRFVHILADNSHITEVVRPYHPKSCREIDAFLPPKVREDVLADFSKSVPLVKADFNIFMVGWFRIYKDLDLYGFDMMLDALHHFTKEGADIRVFASINDILDRDLYEAFLKKRNQYGLDDRFILFDAKFDEVWPFLVHADLFVRPTCTDGSALSIKEALWFETPVLASDCVPRPDDSQLFENRSLAQFIEGISKNMKNPRQPVSEKMKIASQKKFYYPIFKELYEVETI